MKSYKFIVYGLIGSVLLVITLVVRQECDPEPATRAWKRLAQRTTAIHSVDSMTSSTTRPRPIRLKPRIKPKGTTMHWLHSGSSTRTGYDASFSAERNMSTAETVFWGQQADVIPGQGLNSAVEWSKFDIDEVDQESTSRSSSVGGVIAALLTEGALQELYDGEPKPRAEYYGVPVHGQNYVVIYNAVPKTGSRAFFGAIRAAVDSSEYTRHIRLENIRRRDRRSRKDFFSFIYNLTPPLVLRGHVTFVELPSRFLYINMIRDPMERFISEYYFMRNGDSRIRASSSQRSHGYDPKNLPEGWNDTLDDCVIKGSPLCAPRSGMMRLFCGFSLNCSTPSKWTLDQAKSNLDRYTMVGLIDDFEGSLEILERLLPDMTGKVAATFRNRKKTHEASKYRTINRQEPLDSTKKVLRHQMSYEYDFYHLVRGKFFKLKESLGIS